MTFTNRKFSNKYKSEQTCLVTITVALQDNNQNLKRHKAK